MHFTPTSASCLNMVDRFFRDITQQRIRRGVFRSVSRFVTAINPIPTITTKRPSRSSGLPKHPTLLRRSPERGALLIRSHLNDALY